MKNKLLAELDSMPMDFVLSVGFACRTGQQIKHAGLRFTAAPLDWMQLYPLETVTHLFSTGFTDFFGEIEEEAHSADAHGKRRVWDTKNHISSIHHFPVDKSLEEGQADMRKTMMKRYQRIHGIMQSAKRICLVCNRHDVEPELLQFLAEFSKIYPKAEVVLINMRDIADAEELTMQKYEQDGHVLYQACFRDVHPDGGEPADNPLAWHGNTPCWQEVLSHVHLNPKAQRKANSKLRQLVEKIQARFE